MSVVLYHRTTRERAETIVQDGFRDAVGTYLTETTHAGVWLSDVPLDVNEGAKGDALLRVVLDLTDRELSVYEWIEEGKPYGEWLIPAGVVREHLRSLDVSEQ